MSHLACCLPKLLAGIGLHFTRKNRLDYAHCNDMPVTIVFLPASDIAKYVSDGNVDLGITGQDIIAESKADVDEIQQLGFGKCKLAVEAPRGVYQNPAELAGKRIVTSFPHLAKEYFSKFDGGGGTTVTAVGGSVEVACSLGLAEVRPPSIARPSIQVIKNATRMLSTLNCMASMGMSMGVFLRGRAQDRMASVADGMLRL